MTTTQRPRPQRPTPPAPNPASRGVILVAVAVVLGAILLIKGGGIGFDQTDEQLTIDTAGDTSGAGSTTTTTEPPTPSTSVAPASLTLVALNGAGTNGYAASAQQFLSVAGYTSTTAATAAQQATTTKVYYAPGFEADALAIAELLGLDSTSVAPLPQGTQLARNSSDLPDDTDVVVVLGPDVQNQIQPAGTSSGSSSTTTSTPRSTTTSTLRSTTSTTAD